MTKPLESRTTEAVRQSLEGGEIHEAWEQSYRSEANERFCEFTFDVMLRYAAAPAATEFLDVGCGPGLHALRLARRGYKVRAVDFSPYALQLARNNIKRAAMQDRVRLQHEDLLALSFDDCTFERILCWGVLMHIPNVNRAIAELSRVLAPGGILVLSETNCRSIELLMFRGFRLVFGHTDGCVRTPPGIEYWSESTAGPLMTRHSNISWLVGAFEARGLGLVKRLPGQFSEAYTKVGPTLGEVVHEINWFWARHIRSPLLSTGNIVIMQKQEP